MPIDRDRLEKLSQPVIRLYLELQQEILTAIVKRLKDNEGLLVDDVLAWQIEKLNQLGGLTQEVIRLIAEIAGVGVRDMVNMLREAGVEALGPNESLLEAAKRKGANLNQPPPIRDDPTIRNILEAYERQAADVLNLVNATLLSQSQQVYRDIINRTTAEVLAGIKSPQQAIRDTVREWAHQGIPALIDRSGRRWGVEGYVGMVVRTMSNRVANEMQDARMDEWGVDLIEVSSHRGARLLCAPYQGRIFSRSGNHPKYPAFSETSYGKPAGLFGINCGHVKYPYIEGVSIQRYHPYNEAENAQAYKESQKQRAIERAIRNAKTELKLFEEMGDGEGAAQARARLRRQQERMRKFIEETGRTRRYDREQIYS